MIGPPRRSTLSRFTPLIPSPRNLPPPAIPRVNTRVASRCRQQQPLPSPLGEGGPAGPDEGEAPAAACSRTNRRGRRPRRPAKPCAAANNSPCLPPWGEGGPAGPDEGEASVTAHSRASRRGRRPRRPAKHPANGHPPGNHPQTSAHANLRAGHARPLPGDNPAHLYTT